MKFGSWRHLWFSMAVNRMDILPVTVSAFLFFNTGRACNQVIKTRIKSLFPSAVTLTT